MVGRFAVWLMNFLLSQIEYLYSTIQQVVPVKHLSHYKNVLFH